MAKKQQQRIGRTTKDRTPRGVTSISGYGPSKSGGSANHKGSIKPTKMYGAR